MNELLKLLLQNLGYIIGALDALTLSGIGYLKWKLDEARKNHTHTVIQKDAEINTKNIEINDLKNGWRKRIEEQLQKTNGRLDRIESYMKGGKSRA